MQFKSSSQQKKCFATNGFGGRVDCKKWSDMTNQKTLPKKLKSKKKK